MLGGEPINIFIICFWGGGRGYVRVRSVCTLVKMLKIMDGPLSIILNRC